MQTDSAVDFYNLHASEFDKKYKNSSNFQERKRLLDDLIQKYSISDGRVLDLGCGSGIFTELLATQNNKVIAVDGSKNMLNICKARLEGLGLSNVEYIHSQIQFLSWQVTGSFDLIICSSILEYLPDLGEALNLVRTLLKRDGILIFSIPNRSSLYRKLEPWLFKIFGRPKYYRYVKNVFTRKQMENWLRETGFQALAVDYFGKTPLVSRVFGVLGLKKYSENLMIIIAK